MPTRRTGFNFPSRIPTNTAGSGLKYPLNLNAGGRNYYTQFSFRRYSPPVSVNDFDIGGVDFGIPEAFSAVEATGIANLLNNVGAIFSEAINYGGPIGSNIILPLPRKLNDNQVIAWQEVSLTDTLTSLTNISSGRNPNSNIFNPVASAVDLFNLSGIATGVKINPYFFVYFNRPDFRQFSLTWTMAARNEQESRNIKDIITEFKKRAAPRIQGPLMLYPDIVNVRFYPNDDFQSMELKDCVIRSVMADYTPQGPSYFSDSEGNATAAPTLVNLTLNLQEISLWEQNDYDSGATP